MVASPRSLPDPVRERIAMTRVLCIGCMIYVHVPDNALVAGSIDPSSWSALVQGFFIEGAGRASAALLSLVSGLLTAIALTRAAPASLYRRRFRSIVVPMLLWSVATVALYALVSLFMPTFLHPQAEAAPSTTAWRYVNTVLFVTDMPYGPTMHLGFLRDLFVCILLSPLLLALLRRGGPLVLAALAALYLFDVESVLVLRPLVVFAFAIGLWLAERDAPLDALDARWPSWVLLSVLATALVMLSGTEAGRASAPARWFDAHGLDLRETLLYPLSRLFGALSIWTLTAHLVGSRWYERLDRVSPYVFVAFCSHYLVLTLLGDALVVPLIGSGDNLAFLAWFVAAPFVAMLCAALLVESVARVLPSLAALLTGGRVGGPNGDDPGRSSALGRHLARGRERASRARRRLAGRA